MGSATALAGYTGSIEKSGTAPFFKGLTVRSGGRPMAHSESGKHFVQNDYLVSRCLTIQWDAPRIPQPAEEAWKGLKVN